MDTRNPDTDSERRQATVLFADIAGFTAMSERMDPEDVTNAVNRCFAMLEDVVRQQGGHVDKYIGDCVMALFGLPKALEHAPRQAVNAAIEMRRRLYAMNEEQRLPTPLAIHIGINSGLVVAGHVGGAVKRDYTVMGDVVNLASRLKDAAPKGSVYVGPETHRYTADDFEYRQLPALRVKGKEVAVVAYELRSSTARVHRPSVTRGERTIFSTLVGRDAELAYLREAVSAVTRGHGGIVNLVGEAGMGKSRLIAELLASEGIDAVTRLEGRAVPVGHGLAFHPFIDLLRHWAGITEDDGDQAALGKLEAAIARVAAPDVGELLPFVGTLMGMRLTGAHAARIAGIDGEAMEKLITKSMRDVLHAMATARPVVLVLEDLHWADLSSIKLLEFLLRLAVEAPVLFVLALRPDHPQTSQRVLKLAHERWPRHVVDVELAPLDAAECDVLVQNLLATDDLPYPVRAAIVRKAEGNPFYIEEVVRSLVDQGMLEARHGRFRVIRPLDAVVIPGTVQEVIMARVDRLPDRPRRILQIASVVGRRFPYPVLAEILHDDAQLEWALGHLRRSALLEECRVGDEVEYAFNHALIQETVYGSLLQKTRRDLHIDVARAIETLYASRLPDFFGMLAYHYSRAEDLEKAEEYLLKAGDEAARAAAPSEALNYFREASRVYLVIHGAGGDPAKKALLERNIALALFQTGNLIESSEHFDRALAHLGERVPTSRVEILARFAIDLIALLAHLYLPLRVRRSRSRPTDRDVMQLRYTRARAQITTDPRRYFIDTIGSLRRLGQTDPTTIDQACGMYAGGAALFAYSGISFAVGKRFLDIARGLVREGNVSDLFFYRAMQFVCDYLEGSWGDDRAIDEALVAEALRQGQMWDVFVYRGLEAERRAHRGDFAGAREQIAHLKDLSDLYGFVTARSNEYAMTAVLLTEQGRFEPALEMLDLYYTSQHEDVFHSFALASRAKVETLRGDHAGATATMAAADALVRRIGLLNAYNMGVYLASRLLYDVTALERAGDGAGRRALARRARRTARRAVRIAGKVARERPEVYRLAGRLAWLLGNHERATAWWTRSIDAAEALGARPELGRTYREIGVSLAATDRVREVRGMDAGRYVDAAQRLFAELGLDRDAELLDARAAGNGVRVPAAG